jgi:hypothetical protein
LSTEQELKLLHDIFIDSTTICNDLINIICQYADSRPRCNKCEKLIDITTSRDSLLCDLCEPLCVYASAYNILRIMSGMGGIRYST